MTAAAFTRGEVLVHQALPYGSEAEFVKAGSVFLDDDTDAIVAIASVYRLALLREQLGDRLECHDATTWFETPARTLSTMVAAARERWWPHGRARVFVEPLWTGRTRTEIREWKRFECLLNVVFSETPTWLLCAYDTRRLPGDVLRDAARTHHGDGYEHPADFYASCNTTPLTPQIGPVSHRGFMRGELPSLRSFVARVAGSYGLHSTMPLVMAVNEVATNIIVHGSGRGQLMMWSDGFKVVCDLLDDNAVLEDHFLGFIPPSPDRPGGGGMWAVRQLCDLVEIRDAHPGTVFRLHLSLGNLQEC